MEQTTLPTDVSDLAKAIDETVAALNGALRPQVAARVFERAEMHTGRLCKSLGNLTSRRIDRINANVEPTAENESKEQYAARRKVVLKALDPGPMGRELSAKLSGFDWVKRYDDAMDKLVERGDVGKIAARYRLESQVTTALAAYCVAPVVHAAGTLRAHGEQVRTYSNLMKQAHDQALARSGLTLAATVAGAFLGGRIGAAVGRGLAGLLNGDQAERLAQSEGAMFDTFNSFHDAMSRGIAEAHDRLTLVTVTVYGGLALRLNTDLETLGHSLADCDFDIGEPQLALSPAGEAATQEWTSSILRRTRYLRRAGRNGEAADLADRAIRTLLSNPLQLEVCDNEAEVNCAVLLTRERTHGLGCVADDLWRSGEHMEAAAVYRLLLEDSWIAAEPELEGTGIAAPERSVFALAGVRLALWATVNGSTGVEQQTDLLAFVRFLVLAKVRFDLDRRFQSLVGEEISAEAMAISGMLLNYADSLDLPVTIGDRVNESDSTQAAESSIRETADALVDYRLWSKYLIASDSSLNSNISQWLRKRQVAERFGMGLFVAGALGILGAAVYGIYWLVT